MQDDKEFEQENGHQSTKNCVCSQNEDYKGKFLSLMADFQNFKKRTAQEQVSWTNVAKEDVILGFLPIKDELERILANAPTQQPISPEIKIWLDAVEALDKVFGVILSKNNVQEISCTGHYNPELHEVISTAQGTENNSPGEIVQVFKKGYLVDKKVLRHAQVVVA